MHVSDKHTGVGLWESGRTHYLGGRAGYQSWLITPQSLDTALAWLLGPFWSCSLGCLVADCRCPVSPLSLRWVWTFHERSASDLPVLRPDSAEQPVASTAGFTVMDAPVVLLDTHAHLLPTFQSCIEAPYTTLSSYSFVKTSRIKKKERNKQTKIKD